MKDLNPLTIGPFTVALERKRLRRSIRLVVDRCGGVVVRAALHTPVRVIEDFVLANVEWIESQTRAAEAWRAKHPRKQFEPGERFFFLGVERELRFESSTAGRARRLEVEVIESYLVVRGGSGDIEGQRHSQATKAAVAKAVHRFYEKQARLHLGERVNYWSERMSLKPKGISFRRQRTRWGSCSSQGHLSFNWKLIFAPEVVIDYVIIHELAHLVHANHSSRFWDLVKKYDPECQRNRRWLRDHQLHSEFLSIQSS